MIRINCFIQVEEAHRDEVLAAAKELVAATQKNDEGCVSYDFFASTTRNDVFMFCETWVDDAALTAHSRSEHFLAAMHTIKGGAKISIEKMELPKKK